MKHIRVFVMQKDESDILEDWILYHGWLFGYHNLFIIDNFSTDVKCQEILDKYKDKGISVRQLPDYKKKGKYLLDWCREFPDTDIFIPLDIDEFVIALGDTWEKQERLLSFVRSCLSFDYNYYTSTYQNLKSLTPDKVLGHYLYHGFSEGKLSSPFTNNGITLTNCQDYLASHPEIYTILDKLDQKTQTCQPHPIVVDKDLILRELELLPPISRYGFRVNYTSLQYKLSFADPLKELIYFSKEGGRGCKNFFIPENLLELDHGHHLGRCSDLNSLKKHTTSLGLIHYHFRGDQRTILKAINDITGLGYPLDADYLRSKYRKHQIEAGKHKVGFYLRYLDKGYMTQPLDNSIKSIMMSEKILSLRSNDVEVSLGSDDQKSDSKSEAEVPDSGLAPSL